MAADTAIHEKNLEALATNKTIEEKIRAFMANIGLPKEYTERDPKSRARFPKTITHNSGWVQDIHRFIPTSDGFERQESSYNEMKVRYDKFHEEAKKKAEYEEGAKERELANLKKKREEDIKLAGIIGRYDLDILSTWEDVLSALCNKDRLLNLAVAMEQTRSSWIDGCYRVTDALFDPSTPQEKEIIDNVAPYCDDFEDGRVFRDCQWSYDVIYSVIENQQLVNDAREAMSRMS